MTYARRLTRRSVLAAGAMAVPLLAACGTSVLGTRSPLRDPVRTESLGTERTLIAVYERALAATPSLAPTLAPFLAQHREHAAALGDGLPTSPAPSASTTPAPTGAASDQPATTSAADVLAGVAAAEREAMLAHAGACARTTDGTLAALLSLISASEAQHVAVLGTTAAAATEAP